MRTLSQAAFRYSVSRVLLAGAAGALVIGTTSPASAQGISPQQTAPSPLPPRLSQELIVTATLTPLTATALPRTVTVVSSEQMARLGLPSPIAALRLVPGVDVRARGPMDVQSDFSIRGATFGQNLILLDGVRLNDSQSAHHNGELPLPSTAIDRIEVVAGPGSAVHGADALGGTIHLISRRGRYTAASFSGGQHGYADGEITTNGAALPDAWTVSGWGRRSGGFTFDRDFTVAGAAVRGTPRPRWTVDLRHERRRFGANGFYGPSPSLEWTDQTVGSAGWQGESGGWTIAVTAAGRNHGDHFRWDLNRPGFAENRHRTSGGGYRVSIARGFGAGASLTVGASGGGDWIRSSNLGDHGYARSAVFAEAQQTLGRRTRVVAGLRVDQYSRFGRSTSPSVAAVTQVARDVRLRASLGRAFRVPSFTELYYTDPSNLGTPTLVAERGWAVDGGVEWTPGAWTSSLSVFQRRDSEVIDWVRESPADRWRSSNVRDVTSSGFEVSLARTWGPALLRLAYAGLSVDAPALALESKYVLEYARHQSGGSLAVPVGLGVRAAVNVDHRHRRDGQSYDLVGLTLTRPVRRVTVLVTATNLLNERYREIAGVDMPGRWVVIGARVR